MQANAGRGGGGNPKSNSRKKRTGNNQQPRKAADARQLAPEQPRVKKLSASIVKLGLQLRYAMEVPDIIEADSPLHEAISEMIDRFAPFETTIPGTEEDIYLEGTESEADEEQIKAYLAQQHVTDRGSALAVASALLSEMRSLPKTGDFLQLRNAVLGVVQSTKEFDWAFPTKALSYLMFRAGRYHSAPNPALDIMQDYTEENITSFFQQNSNADIYEMREFGLKHFVVEDGQDGPSQPFTTAFVRMIAPDIGNISNQLVMKLMLITGQSVWTDWCPGVNFVPQQPAV